MTADVLSLNAANPGAFDNLPPAPRGLSRKAKTKWRQLQAAYVLDDSYSCTVLEQALEAYDDVLTYKKQIKIDGVMVPAAGVGRPSAGKDNRQVEMFPVSAGPARPHPLLGELDKARRTMVGFLVKLRIDVSGSGNPVPVSESPKTRKPSTKPSWAGE